MEEQHHSSMTKKYITKKELAERWQCHPTNIDYHVRIGNIKASKVKNRMRYLLKTVEAFELGYSKRIRVAVERKASLLDKIVTWMRRRF